jgi:hypothetical protein
MPVYHKPYEMLAVLSSETLVTIYKTTECHSPEDCNPQIITATFFPKEEGPFCKR